MSQRPVTLHRYKKKPENKKTPEWEESKFMQNTDATDFTHNYFSRLIKQANAQ